MGLFECLTYSILGVSFLSSFLIVIHFLKLNYSERIMGFYIIILSIFEFVAEFWILLFPNVESNLPGLHLYTLIEFIVLFLFFHSIFLKFNIKIYGKFLLVIGVVLIVYNSLFIQDIYTYNGNARITIDILIILSSIMFFVFYLLKISYQDQKYHDMHILFVTVLFLKSCLSLLFYIYFKVITSMSESLLDSLFNMRGAINLICAFIYLKISYHLFSKYRLPNSSKV